MTSRVNFSKEPPVSYSDPETKSPTQGLMPSGSDLFRKVLEEMNEPEMPETPIVTTRRRGNYTSLDSARTRETPDEPDGQSVTSEGPKYLSCKRYPWVCVRNKCTHKHEYCVWYDSNGAISNTGSSSRLQGDNEDDNLKETCTDVPPPFLS